MTMRIATGIALFVALCLAGAVVAQAPQTQAADYGKWGFRVGVPPDADKIEFQADGSTLLSEVYVKDGFAYQIKVTSVFSDLLTPTEIEKAIQAAIGESKADQETVRWELEAKDKRLFKGYNHEVTFDADTLARMPYLQNILPQGSGVESIAMAQVSDDTSPILSISVIGPKEKAADIATRAKFTAFTVEKIDVKENETPQPRPRPVIRPAAPTTVPAPAKKRPELGKGDIELVGVVESIGKDGKSLVLVVNQIKLAEQDVTILDPARPKTVVFDRLPEGAKAGVKLLVIGKNEGVGKPIKPAYTEPVK